MTATQTEQLLFLPQQMVSLHPAAGSINHSQQPRPTGKRPCQPTSRGSGPNIQKHENEFGVSMPIHATGGRQDSVMHTHKQQKGIPSESTPGQPAELDSSERNTDRKTGYSFQELISFATENHNNTTKRSSTRPQWIDQLSSDTEEERYLNGASRERQEGTPDVSLQHEGTVTSRQTLAMR